MSCTVPKYPVDIGVWDGGGGGEVVNVSNIQAEFGRYSGKFEQCSGKIRVKSEKIRVEFREIYSGAIFFFLLSKYLVQ